MTFEAPEFDGGGNITGEMIGIPKDLRKYVTKGWTIIVHEDNANPSILVKTHGYLMGVNWNKEVSITVKEVSVFLSLLSIIIKCLGDTFSCFFETFNKIKNFILIDYRIKIN